MALRGEEKGLRGRVLFVVRGDDRVPSSRFRAYQYKGPLADLGVRADYLQIEPSSNLAAQARFHYQLATVGRDYDAVVYLKQLEAFRIALLRRSCPRVFFDFDDAIYLSEGEQRFRRTLRAAHGVIAGNETLAAEARRTSSSVAVIPTVVQVPARAPAFPPLNGEVRLLWVGTSDNIARYLDPVLVALRQVRQRHPQVVLRLVTERPERVPDLAGVVPVRWTPEVEVQELMGCHVGLMPLQDDAWSRGKCACKALQYLAAGRPVVSSPVGVNQAIFDGRNFGWLASDVLGWQTAIEDVLVRANRLPEMGVEGHAFVGTHYSVASWSSQLWRLLKGES